MAVGEHVNGPASYGPVDAGDAQIRVIHFAADGGAPAALRRLAAVLEGERSVLHNVWLGVPAGSDTEQLVFVTLRPFAGDRAAGVEAPPVVPERADLVGVG